jgi:hypothetical protein
MPSIFAHIVISNTEIESDRIFSDMRNQFRGLFEITSLKSERTGKRIEGFTYYSFYVHSNQKDSPIVLSILKELGFQAKYI